MTGQGRLSEDYLRNSTSSNSNSATVSTARRNEPDHKLATDFNTIDVARESVAILNTQFRMVSANKAFINLFGYQTEDLIGRLPIGLLSTRNKNLSIARLRKAINADNLWAGTCWMTTKSGENILCSVSFHYEVTNESTGIVMTVRNVEAETSAKEHMDFLLHHDPRSGMLNREGAVHLLRNMITTGLSNLAVLVVGVSNMPAIRDSLGWRMAEHANESVAKRIIGITEADDIIVAKIGDSRFCLIARTSNIAEIHAIGKRVSMAIYNAIELNNKEVYPVPIIGFARHPEHGKTEDALIENASIAMNNASKGMVGQVNEFTSSSRKQVSDKVDMENLVRKAVKNRQFQFMAQPQVNMIDGSVSGAEILIRPSKEAAGCPPCEIIQVAESTGMIHEIGRQALFAGMEFCRDYGNIEMTIAINVSSIQFAEQTIVADVDEALTVTGANGRNIGIEITESVLFNEEAPVKLQLATLREMGCKIIIDDFGVGYANLAYLKQYAKLIDKVKIDRMFITDCLTNRESAIIARSIINLSKDLRIGLVAEGVENQEVAKWLVDNGCVMGQGYLFGKAVPPERFWEATKFSMMDV